MPQKRKRSWTMDSSREHGHIKKRAEARKQREDYKLERIRALIEQGFTKDHLDVRLDRYYCMKEHPGRLCSQCNPRADEEDNEGLSDKEAEMSDSWSEGTAFDDDNQSLTYSEIWYNEEEKDKVVKYIKGKIEAVDSATKRLKTLVDDQQAGKPPIGGLRGEWTLYNLDVCPKRYEPTGEYYRLTVSEAAVKGELLSQDRIRHPPYETFIEWLIKDAGGDILPFPLPTHASLEPVSIRLMTAASDVPAEIVFLGNNCLWLRAPRSIVYPNEPSRLGTSSPMIEFAGVRQTEADIEGKKRRQCYGESFPRTLMGLGKYAGLTSAHTVATSLNSRMLSPKLITCWALPSQTFSLIYPILLWMHDFKPYRNGTVKEKANYGFNVLIALIGLFMVVACTYADAISIRDAFRSGSIGKVFDCADNSGSVVAAQ